MEKIRKLASKYKVKTINKIEHTYKKMNIYPYDNNDQLLKSNVQVKTNGVGPPVSVRARAWETFPNYPGPDNESNSRAACAAPDSHARIVFSNCQPCSICCFSAL